MKTTELQKRIKYFQSLADNLPNDLEDGMCCIRNIWSTLRR